MLDFINFGQIYFLPISWLRSWSFWCTKVFIHILEFDQVVLFFICVFIFLHKVNFSMFENFSFLSPANGGCFVEDFRAKIISFNKIRVNFGLLFVTKALKNRVGRSHITNFFLFWVVNWRRTTARYLNFLKILLLLFCILSYQPLLKNFIFNHLSFFLFSNLRTANIVETVHGPCVFIFDFISLLCHFF